MQHPLITNPVVPQMINLAILFLDFHKSEIRSPIPTRSVDPGACFEFILLCHPFYELR
jgi:hypothetical protein